jgi:hypothetical protein
VHDAEGSGPQPRELLEELLLGELAAGVGVGEEPTRTSRVARGSGASSPSSLKSVQNSRAPSGQKPTAHCGLTVVEGSVVVSDIVP